PRGDGSANTPTAGDEFGSSRARRIERRGVFERDSRTRPGSICRHPRRTALCPAVCRRLATQFDVRVGAGILSEVEGGALRGAWMVAVDWHPSDRGALGSAATPQ